MLRLSDIKCHPACACRCWRSTLPLAGFWFDPKTFLDSLPHYFLATEDEKEEHSSEKVVPTPNSENYFKGVILARIWFNGLNSLCLFAEDQVVDTLKEPREANDEEEFGK